MKMTGFYSVLNISPYRMKPETRKKVEGIMDGGKELSHLNVIPLKDGAYILMFGHKELYHKDTPEDLKRIMEYANSRGAYMVYFDPRADHPVIDGLPVYLP